jgi:Ca2+-transporting ATPase
MDLGASTTFVFETAEATVMNEPPRDPKQPFIDRPFIHQLLRGSLSLSLCVLVPFMLVELAPNMFIQTTPIGQTLGFACWIFGHLLLALHYRTLNRPILLHGLLTNKLFIVWCMSAVTLLIVSMHVPLLGHVLGLVPLTAMQWLLCIGICIICTSWIEVIKWTRFI